MNFLIVAFGAALGGCGRYAISLMTIKSTFPYLTLLVNIIGAVLIGFIVGIVDDSGKSNINALFWKTGVCGGFTTFSTFSLEIVQLLENQHYALSGIYVTSSVVGCLIGVVIGKKLVMLLH